MAFLDELFDQLWRDYAAITPQAARVHALLAGRGERLINDHIALRTFDHPAVAIEVIDRAFVEHGYQPAETYDFPEKRLVAYHYEHPEPGRPKVFVSALLVEHCSPALCAIVEGLLDQLPAGAAAHPLFTASGRRWSLDRATYRALAAESEYAAWIAAFGFRANHFTIDAGQLTSVAGLAELADLLAAQGFRLNQEGGLIKGSAADLLEQIATVADEVEVELADGVLRIPSCYCEFARRYPRPDGTIFQGFVPGSAARLFGSTDRRA